MANPKPWVTDAIDLDLPEKLEDIRNLLFLENYRIAEFLNVRPDVRDTKFLIVAPKGFGKTLMLKAKRAAIKSNSPHTLLMPQGSLIDRPPGIPPTFSRSAAHDKASDIQFWKTIWIMAICLSIIHTCDRDFLKDIDDDFVKKLYKATVQHTPCDIFNSLLYLTKSQYFHVSRACASVTMPYYRSINKSIAIFIDNIDDYFYPQIGGMGAAESIYKDESRMIWALAQIGLAEAIRELRSMNTGIKPFAALRKEALLRGYSMVPNIQQLFGIAIDLQYDKEELRQIFFRNIALDVDRHEKSQSSSIMAKLVGDANLMISHRFTGKKEEIFDFIFRHSLGRPRDLIVMGGNISEINTPRDGEKIRNAVFAGAKSSVSKHFQDMSCFIPVPALENISKFIHKNVMSIEELKKTSQEYLDHAGKYDPNANEHPYCSLYRMGLLGVTERNELGSETQKFLHPDAITLDRTEEILPTSGKYLIHPSMDASINESRGDDYKMNFERFNIIGDKLPWSDNKIDSYVLNGDIVKISEVMFSPEYGSIFLSLFQRWVSEACRNLESYQVQAGDNVTIVDKSPVRLLRAAQQIADSLAKFSRMPRKIRFGASSGPVEYKTNEQGFPRPEGMVLRTAARLEPLARPNSILATSDFVEGLLEFGYDMSKVRAVKGNDLPALDSVDDEFSLSKGPGDLIKKVRLWKICLD